MYKFTFEVPAVPFTVYVTTDAAMLNIPDRLQNRVVRKNISISQYDFIVREYDVKELTADTVLTGNDSVVIREGDTITDVTFSELVGLAGAMGEGYLVDRSTGKAIDSTPVIDYDYQDAYFESIIS